MIGGEGINCKRSPWDSFSYRTCPGQTSYWAHLYLFALLLAFPLPRHPCPIHQGLPMMQVVRGRERSGTGRHLQGDMDDADADNSQHMWADWCPGQSLGTSLEKRRQPVNDPVEVLIDSSRWSSFHSVPQFREAYGRAHCPLFWLAPHMRWVLQPRSAFCRSAFVWCSV